MIRRVLLAAVLLTAVLLGAALTGAARTGSAADEPDFPKLTGRVVDQVGVLSAPLAARLTAELAAHQRRTGQQVVVAVVKSLDGLSIEDYGYQLGRAWGIGQKGADTGAILLAAPADRKVRIEVGYGLEGDLTDAASATIIDQAILPRFRVNDYAGGIVAGAEQMLRVLGDTVTPPPPQVQPRPHPSRHGFGGAILVAAIVIAILAFVVARGGGSGLLPLLFLSSLGDRRDSDFPGGGSDRSDDDDFKGEGGSFGGGGASGSW